ncbi:MAG: hypothetical protein ACXW2E_01710 [Nitrososphaeraceae archaeon]
MNGPAPENDFAKHSKEMQHNIPKQMDNKNYGKKRKAQAHKFSVKDSKTGKVYWTPCIMEKLTFKTFLITESSDTKTNEKLTTLPEIIISELKKLISKGAKDITQNWRDAKELTDTAYAVARVRRPIPDQRGAWKQYTELLRYGVNQLWNSRGNKGSWRSSDVMYSESYDNIPIYEGQRFFVTIPNTADVEIEADDLSQAVKEMINKLRRHGASSEVTYRTGEGAILTVFKNGEQTEEIIIRAIS